MDGIVIEYIEGWGHGLRVRSILPLCPRRRMQLGEIQLRDLEQQTQAEVAVVTLWKDYTTRFTPSRT